LKGVGLKFGYVGPEDVDGTFGIGFVANHGTFTPRTMLESYLSYWSKTEEEYGLEASIRDIALGARAKYLFDVPNSNVRPFVGAGLGLHFLHAEVTMPAQDIGGIIIPGYSVDDSSTKLGLDMGGGMFVPINPRWDFMTELWYGVVNDVNQLSFTIGAVYKLGM
jgi:opacity protein-like surface antigen